MNIELSQEDVDLIVIALKGFVDDNLLFADEINNRMSKKELDSIKKLNKQAELLIISLDDQTIKNQDKKEHKKDNAVKKQQAKTTKRKENK